jgi:hypothetical protein
LTKTPSNGTVVGTVTGQDVDAGETFTYSLLDSAGDRFAINNAGQITVAGGTLLDREADASHTITVQVTDASGATFDKQFVIQINDVNEFDVTIPTDVDASANEVNENVAIGTTVGVQVFAVDLDATDNTITYRLTNDSDGMFQIDANTGVVTTAAAIDREVHGATRVITVEATSSDGSTAIQSFDITIVDVNEFDVDDVVDLDATPNQVQENAAIGTAVGIQAFGFDADATNSVVTYSLDDNDGGRFQIDAVTGVVTVGGAIDREIDGSERTIIVRAQSQDGSWQTRSFEIAIGDENEFSIGPIVDIDAGDDGVAENSAIGTSIGIVVRAIDQDATDTTTYSLDDDANGGFVIDALTGEIVTARVFDFETISSYTITVRATSSDTTTTTRTFTVAIIDVNEAPVAIGDAYSVNSSTVLNLGAANGVLNNDTDVDGDPLTAVVVSTTTNGTLTLRADGGLTYTPNPGYFGLDSFTYLADDGDLQSSPVTVSINVVAVTAPVDPGDGNNNSDSGGSGDPVAVVDAGVIADVDSSDALETASTSEDGNEADGEFESIAGSEVGQIKVNGRTLSRGGLVKAPDQSRTVLANEPFELTPRERSETSIQGSTLQMELQHRLEWEMQTMSSWVDWQDDSTIVKEQRREVLIGTATTAASLISVGYVLLALRGGAFVTVVATGLPTWRIVDPTALLTAYRSPEGIAADAVDDIID